MGYRVEKNIASLDVKGIRKLRGGDRLTSAMEKKIKNLSELVDKKILVADKAPEKPKIDTKKAEK